MSVVSQIIDSLDGDYTNEAICSALGSWTWDDPFKEEWRAFIALRWIELWPELSCETRIALFAEASVACIKRNNLRARGLHEVWRGIDEPLELEVDVLAAVDDYDDKPEISGHEGEVNDAPRRNISDAMGSNDDPFAQR